MLGALIGMPVASQAQTPDPAPAKSATSAPSSAADTDECVSSGRYVPPPVAWLGKFVYVVKLTIKNGSVTDVEARPVPGQGTDDATDNTLISSLSDFVKQHYVCKGPNRVNTEYLAVTLKQDIPELSAMRAAGEKVDVIRGVEVKPAICRKTTRPQVPPHWLNTGVVRLVATVQVQGKRIGWIDVKLRSGSDSAYENQRFADSVRQAIRRGYKCTGDRIFEQEFEFSFVGE
ncbi:MAG TPA: hypothetical protein VGM81_11870 [Burkholderiaceae bacterium]|jgi:hypothetical protein